MSYIYRPSPDVRYRPPDYFEELPQTLLTPTSSSTTPHPTLPTHLEKRGGGGGYRGSSGGKSISFPTPKLPTISGTRFFFGSTMASLAYPHPETAEEQSRISSYSILTTHVLHRGFQLGVVLGSVSAVPTRFYQQYTSNNSLRQTGAANVVARPPPLPWRNLVLNGAAYGGIAGTALLSVALWARMRGREEIEWQDRAWRLGANKGQNEVDFWSVAGSVGGYISTVYLARGEAARMAKAALETAEMEVKLGNEGGGGGGGGAGKPWGAGGGATWGPPGQKPPTNTGSPPWGVGSGASWGNAKAIPEAVGAAEGAVAADAAASVAGAVKGGSAVTQLFWKSWRAKVGGVGIGNLVGVAGYMLYRHGLKGGKWEEDVL